MRRQIQLLFACLMTASLLVWVAATACLALPQAPRETPESHQAAGMAYLEAGRLQEALAEFRKAVRLNRNYLPSLLQMADILSSSGQVFEAYGVLQHAVTVAPDSADVHALLGRCFFRMEKLRQAHAELERALELDPKLNEPYFALAIIESRQGRLVDARQHIEKFIQRNPGQAAAQEVLARVSFEMKDYDAALAASSELKKLDPARTETQLEIARTLERAGRYAEAEQAYRAVLEQKPQDRAALRGLFDSSYKRGAYETSVQALQQLVKLEPRSCDPLLNLARAYRMMNQFPLARQQAECCLALEPGQASSHYLLGRLWFAEGNLVRAKADLEEAARSDPNYAEALYWLAMVELRLGERIPALRHLEKAVALDPEHTGARYALALEYARLNRPADQQKQLAEFRRLKSREEWKSGSGEDRPGTMSRSVPSGPVDTAHLSDWIGFASYLLSENKPREALRVLKQAQETAPADAEVSLLEADAYCEIGEIEPALAAYAAAEQQGPTGLLFLGRGMLYRRLGENDPALADLTRAVSMELPAAKAAEAHVLLASLLNEKKQRRQAEAELRRAIALDPKDSAARVVLAWTLLELGRPLEAAAESTTVLNENPDDASARLALARALLEEKKVVEAVRQIERAAAIEGESARVLLSRGRLAAAQGMNNLAIDYLNRAGQLDPSLVEAFFLLGRQLVAANRTSEAAVTFEKVTILDPTHAHGWLELGKIYLAAKRPRDSVSYFQKAVAAAPESGDAHYQLAVALSQTGQIAEAQREAERAKTLGNKEADTLLKSFPPR